MDKAEFLSVLRESLEGYIPMEEVEHNVNFYRNYFKESDLSEKDMIEELGDPRLIARTIIDAYKASKGPMADYYEKQARSEYSRENAAPEGKGKTPFIFRAVAWVCVLAVALAVLFLLARIVGFIIFSLLPVLLVIFLVKLVFDYLKR